MKGTGGNITPTHIERAIRMIRGHKIMLDSDLADLYEVPTKALNRAARRNLDRFPPDFMFELNRDELSALRSQIGTLKKGRGRHRKYLPLVFTEQGVAMLSGLLQSQRAVAVNIEIMRAFVRLRHYLATHKDLALKLDDLEKRHEAKFKAVFDAIRTLMTPPETKRKPIGFGAKD